MIVNLAHGASGNASRMKPYIDGLRSRGLDANAIELPVGKAEKAVDKYRQQVAHLESDVIGGQSYGGRVGSLLAAETAPRGLVLFCYPLHRPGQPDWELRTAHWPRISCPVLLLSGESDPLARIELLRMATDLLPRAELVTYPGVGHGLRPVLEDALDRVAAFVRGL